MGRGERTTGFPHSPLAEGGEGDLTFPQINKKYAFHKLQQRMTSLPSKS